MVIATPRVGSMLTRLRCSWRRRRCATRACSRWFAFKPALVDLALVHDGQRFVRRATACDI
jgi:hypothetical protein